MTTTTTAHPLEIKLHAVNIGPAGSEWNVYTDGTLAGRVVREDGAYVAQLTATAAYLPADDAAPLLPGPGQRATFPDPFTAATTLALHEHRRRLAVYLRNLEDRRDDLTEWIDEADARGFQSGSPMADDVIEWEGELEGLPAEIARTRALLEAAEVAL